MRIILLFTVLAFCSTINGQIDVKKNAAKDSCYFNYNKNGEKVDNPRFTEWQCGKVVGVVNCNEMLEYDQEANIVLLANKDLVNSAGGGKPFTGSCESCFFNGKIERRVHFVDGKEHGMDTTYYKSGCPMVVRSHVNGIENGSWFYMYDSTQYLAWEMNYLNGEKHGKQLYLSKNGDTTKLIHYQNGILHGLKQTYYKDGSIKKRLNYNLGIFDGEFLLYNREGVVIQKLIYKEGKKDQEAAYFYDNGAPLRTENWKFGVKNGSFKVFYIQGKVQSSENYKKGLKQGEFLSYYPDGKLKRSAIFDKDVLLEEHRYDEQGRETYTFGVPDSDGDEDDQVPDGKKKRKKSKK